MTIKKQYFIILCLTLLLSIFSFFQLKHQRQCYEQIYWFKDLINTLSATLESVEYCEENQLQLRLALRNQEPFTLSFTYAVKGEYEMTIIQAGQQRFQAQAPDPYFISNPDLITKLKRLLSKESIK